MFNIHHNCYGIMLINYNDVFIIIINIDCYVKLSFAQIHLK